MLRFDILWATSTLLLTCSIQYNCGWYLGAVIAAWATFGTRNYAGSWAWRVPSLLQVLLPLIGIPGLIMIPESPRWLVSKDRIEEARQNLADIHVGGDTKHPLIEFEMAEIQQTIKAEKEAEQYSAWNDLWATPGNRHRLFISISLGIFAQWAGNGVVSYYLSIILNSVGITSVDDQTLISACLQIWNLIWAVTAALLVERLGRRLLFMTSVSCCNLADYLRSDC
jgi:MFS family permease